MGPRCILISSAPQPSQKYRLQYASDMGDRIIPRTATYNVGSVVEWGFIAETIDALDVSGIMALAGL